MTSKTTLLLNNRVRGQAVAPPKQGLYDPRFEHDACGVGFVVNIKGKKSHAIVQQALQVLRNLQHRGACGSEVNTGDGAGILMQVPHAFLEEACHEMKINLPGPGEYGVGMVFLPRTDLDGQERCRTIVEAEFKPSDFVHYEDIRVDYAPMPIGGKSLYVPVRSFTIAEVVPNADSFASNYAVRHQLVTEDYKDFQAASAR